MKVLNSFSIFLLTLCLLAAGTTLITPARSFIRSQLLSENPRKILSTLKTDFFNNGQLITIAKVKTNDGLFVEIYEINLQGKSQELGKIKLPASGDGFFHFRGQATNLALEDINHDRIPEILAPSYDREHIARLSVIKYNQETKSFELSLPPKSLSN